MANRLISTANSVITRIEDEIGRPLESSHYARFRSQRVTDMGYWKFMYPKWIYGVALDVMGVSISDEVTSWVKSTYESWLFVRKLKLDPTEYMGIMETYGESPDTRAEQLGLDQDYLNLQGMIRGYHDRMKFFMSIPTNQLNARNSQLQLDTTGIEFYHLPSGRKTYDRTSTENAYLSLATSSTRNKVSLATWILQGLVHAKRIEIIEHWR